MPVTNKGAYEKKRAGRNGNSHAGSKLSTLAEAIGWEGVWPDKSRRGRNSSLIHYDAYTLSRKEWLFFVLAGSGALFAGLYIFYQSAVLSGLLSVFGMAAPRYGRAMLLKRRKTQLKLQFKEALFSLTSSLAAGRSIENAFRSSVEDLCVLYGDPDSDIIREFAIICRRLDNGEPLESALRLFAERAHTDEITQFADVIGTCKRSGGDLVEVMKRTATLIGEKLGVEADIMIMIAQKRLESRIMMAVPFVFMTFLGLAAPDYMAPLYNGLGYALLTAALALLLGCYWLMDRLMSFEI